MTAAMTGRALPVPCCGGLSAMGARIRMRSNATIFTGSAARRHGARALKTGSRGAWVYTSSVAGPEAGRRRGGTKPPVTHSKA